VGKIKFTFDISWKNIYGYYWKNPLLIPAGKNPPDAHACSFISS